MKEEKKQKKARLINDIQLIDDEGKEISDENFENKSFIKASYIKILKEIIALNGVLCGFRPPSKISLELMKAGKAIGKGLGISGKTSPFGKNLKGFIPVNQKLSKLATEKDNIELTKEYTKKNKDAIGSKEEKYKNVNKTSLLDKKDREIFFVKDKNGNPVIDEDTGEQIFVCKVGDDKGNYTKDENGDDLLFLEDSDNKFKLDKTKQDVEQVEIMCYIVNGKKIPATGDNDLAFIGTKPHENLKKEEKKQFLEQKTHPREGVDPAWGSLEPNVRQSERQKSIAGYNTETGYAFVAALEDIWNAITHGPETFNPGEEEMQDYAKDDAAGYPCFLPFYDEKGVLDKSKCLVKILKTKDDIKSLYKEFEGRGYIIPKHKNWKFLEDTQQESVSPKELPDIEKGKEKGKGI